MAQRLTVREANALLRRVARSMGDVAPARQLAREAIPVIRRRTRAGVDAAGKAFAPYSKGYQKRKGKRRGRSGTGGLVVDLTDTRDMLNRLTVDVEAAGVSGETSAAVVAGTDRDDRLVRIHAGDEPRKRVPLRDFRGVTPQQQALLEAIGERLIEERVRRALMPGTAG